MATTGDDLLLPEGARLLHIGPHKTGTTTIQGALMLARDTLPEHGVVYPGRERQHMKEALAVTGGKGLIGGLPASMKQWDGLVRKVATAGDKRVIVSSEFFDGADEDAARKVVDELGGPRVHVVVTLRRLADILPSAWQQYVRNRLRHSYDEWLDAMFNQPPYIKPTTTFWARHHHDVLVERWAKVAGPENLTVVVLDPRDQDMLLRTFERFVGLPTGLLVPEPAATNRSFTFSEIELVRQLNKEFRKRKWSDRAYFELVRRGVANHLQVSHQPGPDESRIATPQWALERAAEIGAAAAERISGTGVRIVGDISSLGTAPEALPAPSMISASGEPLLPVSAAVDAIIGVIKATGAQKAPPPAQESLRGRANTVKDLTVGELMDEVRLRASRRLRRR